jgi:hypothetical protein
MKIVKFKIGFLLLCALTIFSCQEKNTNADTDAKPEAVLPDRRPNGF